ncbi:substrate-binding domain-containing protein [Yoonia sp.]|uniref:substrate-binding domain-containing protein n=1 Tax=Yoonia sp. TaxID=2212373 RepID=UPI00391A1271
MKRFLLSACLCLSAFAAQAETLRIAVTTSFENSGLADILLPALQDDTGITAELVVVGTGQALRLGAAGDVDAVLAHAREGEEELIAQGHATHRREIMYNDFVIIGPADDSAGVAQADDALAAFGAIATAQAPFVSRGDSSGTHMRELALWDMASLTPDQAWYRSVGAGMGAALNTASAMNAYILSDRATWAAFGNKGDLALLFAGDAALFNQYAYLPINPGQHSHVRADLSAAVEDWLTSPRAAELIDGFQIDGMQMFTFNAVQPDAD